MAFIIKLFMHKAKIKTLENMLLCKRFYNYFISTLNWKNDSSGPGSKFSLKRCYILMTKSILL